MSVVPDLDDRQSQTKWTMNLTWFHNTVCGELEQDATEERLLRNTRGYIMQLIGGILFPDASDSQVHIRLDHAEHIVGRLDRVTPWILRTRRNLMTWPLEQIRPYLRRVGFEYVAYMVEFEHDWPLASALIERWRPESHTFYLPCRKMTITLQDVAYQLVLRIDADPVSGYIGGWEQHYQRQTIEELCEQILSVVPGLDDRQSQTKWTMNLTWFHNTMHLTLRCISGGSPYWRTLRRVADYCGARLYWHDCTARCVRPWSMVSAIWVGASACCYPGLITIFRLWVQYRTDNARGESRLRHYRRTLNGIRMLNVEWTSYADPQLVGLVPPAIAEAEALAPVVCPLICFAIVEWH
ncbi:hypothetical protein AHAS_Ahas01G0294500 [Arachis hypogaea]